MTDLLVFGGYLVIVLLIGKFTGQRIHSAEDYHLCGRNLGRLPAAMSQAATEFSGSGLIGGAGLAYSVGLAAIWWNWSAAPPDARCGASGMRAEPEAQDSRRRTA